jgi:leader peptidase (prepilin peptidase)/N-methyltransferase
MITYNILAIIPGWLLGMLVNYLADVLPHRRRLTRPFCMVCDTDQKWINYLVWPRKCPECRQRRNIRVWIVELVFIICSVFISYSPPDKIGYWLGMVVLAYFGVVVLIDLEYRLIMHPVSLFGVALGLLVGFLRVGWMRSLIGGVAGFVIMWLIYMLGVLLMKLINRRRGQAVNEVAFGFGDVNLSGVLGLMLGWPGILVGLVVAVLIGGLVSLIYVVVMLFTRKYQAFTALPYGPFLVLGALVLIYFTEQVAALLAG